MNITINRAGHFGLLLIFAARLLMREKKQNASGEK